MVPVSKRRSAKPVLGCVLGILGGGFFAASALLIVAVRGPAMLDRIGLTTASMISFYLVAGGFAGLVVGTLLPLATWRLGAALVGGIGAIPVYAGAGLMLGDLHLFTDLLLAAVVGGAVGYSWWSPHDGAPHEAFH